VEAKTLDVVKDSLHGLRVVPAVLRSSNVDAAVEEWINGNEFLGLR
jgi:hypothetical protein